MSSSAVTEGDKRLAAIRAGFDDHNSEGPWKTDVHQLVTLSLPLIYGEEWKSSAARVLAENKVLEPLRRNVCFQVDRYDGVRPYIVELLSRFLLNCECLRINFFHRKENLSKYASSICYDVRDWIQVALDLPERVVGATESRLAVWSENRRTSSVLMCVEARPEHFQGKPDEVVRNTPSPHLTVHDYGTMFASWFVGIGTIYIEMESFSENHASERDGLHLVRLRTGSYLKDDSKVCDFYSLGKLPAQLSTLQL